MKPEILFLYCRPGFESECASEIQEHASKVGVSGYCKAKPLSGYVVFQCTNTDAPTKPLHQIDFRQLAFVRQWFIVLALRNDLPVDDRIGSIVEVANATPSSAREIFLETPDTNEGKELSSLCRAIERPLRQALKNAGRLDPNSLHALRLHICFLSTNAAYIGYADINNSSPYAMGIPRLKFPRGAPSRSTLKLEEAFVTFLSPNERQTLLRPGMTAVDLGAAPGGWTWQLVKNGVHVVCVDNGALDAALNDSNLVQHHRADGFRFAPTEPVHWMVCDIVEQPIRIADLVAIWFENYWCERAIFNLKLPMKKRYQEVQRCLGLIAERLDKANIEYQCAYKQLYHDREEVTVYLSRR